MNFLTSLLAGVIVTVTLASALALLSLPAVVVLKILGIL